MCYGICLLEIEYQKLAVLLCTTPLIELIVMLYASLWWYDTGIEHILIVASRHVLPVLYWSERFANNKTGKLS